MAGQRGRNWEDTILGGEPYAWRYFDDRPGFPGPCWSPPAPLRGRAGPGRRALPVPITGRPRLKPECVSVILAGKVGQVGVPALGVVVMAKYLALFGFTGETVQRFVANPSDRATVVRGLVESVGGSLECYYWMFGQYDGMAIVEMPDSHTYAAAALAIISSGAFTHFETHELLEADDLPVIAERARSIVYQPPGGRRADRPADSAQGVNPVRRRTG